MKLELKQTKVAYSDKFEEENFSIGNVALIMEILRSKMYTNPIRTLVQEISCNARDAHREIGTPDLPIEIKLPSKTDSSFYVRDFGPGITPDRMSNIFLKYGMSSKRDDNTQTGGFGLGAKSPFAYSDTFCITSVTPEQEWTDHDGKTHKNCLVCRQYVAHIDETRIGKLSLLSSTLSTAKRGTTLQIDCRLSDFGAFSNELESVTRYWNPKPKVLGCPEFKYKNSERIIEGTFWFLESTIQKKYNYYSYTYDYTGTPLALVDGIPYELSSDHLGTFGKDQSLQHLIQYPFRINFNIGDLQLTANRESVEVRDSNAKAIANKFKLIINELAKVVQDRVSSAKSLWEAYHVLTEMSKFYNCIPKAHQFEYGDYKISIQDLVTSNSFYKKAGHDDCLAYSFTRKSSGSYVPKFNKTSAHFEYNLDTILVVDDTTTKLPSRSRVATIFKDNTNINKVYVVKPQKEIDKFENKYVKDLSFGRLSKYDLTQIKVASPTGIRTKVTIVPVKEITQYGTLGTESQQDLEKGTGIYVVSYYNELYNTDRSKGYNMSQLSEIVSTFGTKIYAIGSRHIKDIGPGWTALHDWAQKKYAELLTDKDLIEYSKEIEKNYQYATVSDVTFMCQYLPKIKPLLKNTDNTFVKFLERSIVLQKVQSKLQQFKTLINALTKLGVNTIDISSKSCDTIKSLYEEYISKYTLICCGNEQYTTIPNLSYYNSCQKTISSNLRHIADYVNAMDERKNP